MWFALKGFIIGLAIAAPVGPIGVLCIRRTLTDGRRIGFVSGLGAATADMAYGAVAAFGLTAVQDTLVSQQFWLHWLGGIFLLYLGLRTYSSKPMSAPVSENMRQGWASAYISTLVLTLTNPATILSFTLIFAGLRLADTGGDYIAAAALITGVFLGSAAWWLTLSGVVGSIRGRFNARWMIWANRLAGVVIFSFGAAALLSR